MKRKYLFLGIWVAVILLAKLVPFHMNGNEYHEIINLATLLLYITGVGILIAFLSKRKKVILANITVFILFIFLIELIAFFVLGMPERRKCEFDISVFDPDHRAFYLDYLPPGGTVIHDIQVLEGDTFVEEDYTIDSLNRRVVPERDSSKDKYSIFFGCSVCFGYGLGDRQTIPYVMQSKTSGYNSYNYAYNGWGPHHMLSLLEHENIPDQVHGSDGYAIYIFSWHHIRRAIGDYEIYTGWAHGSPWYEMEDGDVVYKGKFMERWPRSYIYEKLYETYSIQMLGLNFPIMTTKSHIELIANMFRKSKEFYQEKFGNDNFTVVFHFTPEIGVEAEDKEYFLSLLDEMGVNYLDYSKYDEYTRGEYILKDGHPTQISNEVFSSMLIRDLGLEVD